MRNFVFLTALCATALLMAAEDGWKVTEEVSVNGSRVIKHSYFNEQYIKVVNQADTGSNETIIDIANDKITLINHFQKSYQVSKLSDYIKFAEGIANGLKNGGYVNPQKIEPKVVFEKKGPEKVGAWDALHYVVKVDGKEYQEIWVAPALKTSPVLEFRKKYAALLPETLVKYRALDEKIKDQAAAEGMIVRMVKIPINKKLPKIDQTMTEVVKFDITPALLTVPKDYLDKTIVQAAPAQTPAKQ
ncbi:MAG TPA: hypothetical protein PLV42_08820 [bacterium]|nr:hypothetical protein [bacterium]